MRIYYTEPSLRRFEGRVVRVAAAEARQHVWLDRTAFYPTSGGQPFDTGYLNQLRVIDVNEVDGEVVHTVEGRLSPGDAVLGEIDWSRRFDHMQQHSGQHVLSAAFERTCAVRTESVRLGETVSTIDLAREVSATEIAAAEDAANDVVWEGRSVSIRFVSETEAQSLPLRKESARAGRLRLIEIADFDLSACGGTHVALTSEIGMIAVQSAERFRGGTRLQFACGRRALAAHRAWRQSAASAARLLSAEAADLPAAVERLQAETKAARKAEATMAEKAADLEAHTLAARAQAMGDVLVVIEAFAGYDAGTLKRLAAAFVRGSHRAIVAFTDSTPGQVVAMRSADVTDLDCGALVTSLVQRFAGRGGGKPNAAQGGGLSASATEWCAFARSCLQAAGLAK